MSAPPEGRRATAGRIAIGLSLFGLAGIGWWRHSVAFALFGVMGLFIAGTMRVFQRHCLDGVTYRRSLSVARTPFGEEVVVSSELVNDKLLPLTWIEIRDEVPTGLSISGVSLVEDETSGRRYALSVSPILPYQRIRRRVAVTADRRGRYEFGPGRLRSGDPVAFRTREQPVRERLELLVFPKLLSLAPLRTLPQVLLGEQRARVLLGDPSRVAGVRDYRPGDPLRYVDWRASARSAGLLVREHEPTASLRTAVFVDLTPYRASEVPSADLLEFTISVAASVVAAFVEAGVGVGLFGSGTAQRRPIHYPPSTSPAALGAMLELLAEASPYGPASFAEVLTTELSRLSVTTSIVVVAAAFSERVLSILAQRHRRGALSTVWVKASADAWPPMLEDNGVNFTASYRDDWINGEELELA